MSTVYITDTWLFVHVLFPPGCLSLGNICDDVDASCIRRSLPSTGGKKEVSQCQIPRSTDMDLSRYCPHEPVLRAVFPQASAPLRWRCKVLQDLIHLLSHREWLHNWLEAFVGASCTRNGECAKIQQSPQYILPYDFHANLVFDGIVVTAFCGL